MDPPLITELNILITRQIWTDFLDEEEISVNNITGTQ